VLIAISRLLFGALLRAKLQAFLLDWLPDERRSASRGAVKPVFSRVVFSASGLGFKFKIVIIGH